MAVFFIIVMSVVGVTSKLSFIVFGLTLIGLSLALWFYRERGALTLALRDAALWLIVAGTLIGLPWMINGILTSGYPVFPSTIGALPVDYRIPTAVTKDAADWIISFARSPHQDETITLTSWDWIPVWWGNTQDPFLQFLFVFPFLFALLSLYFYVGLLIIFRKYRPPADRRLWLILIPGITSGIFWFVSAPDPRFAGATFWILALWGGILLSTLGQKKASRWSITLALVIPAIVGLVLVGIQPRTEFDLSNKGFPDLPVAPIRTFTTDSGLVVNMPADDNNDLQLWDMPQPASPYEIPGLELRGNTLQDGFRTRPNP